MIFERYYDKLQLAHFALYRRFFDSAADYNDVTEAEWMELKRRVAMGRDLHYDWSCEMDPAWRAQLTHEEREILANWDWYYARKYTGIDKDVWRRYLTPGELALEGQEAEEK